MIIDGMSKAEIVESINHDIFTLSDRLNELVIPKLKRLLAKSKKKQILTWDKYRCHFNDYIVVFAVTKKNNSLYIVNYHQTSIGLRFVAPYIGLHNWSFYNAHFISRYRERMELDIEDPLEVAAKYFMRNIGFADSQTEIRDNKRHYLASITDGITLGYKQENIYTWNTFVALKMLSKNQAWIDKKNVLANRAINIKEALKQSHLT